MENLDKTCYGKLRKTKAYGLVGCLAFSLGLAGVILESNYDIVNAAVVDGGRDIKDSDVNSTEASGVAMTYTRFDSNGSPQTASGSGVFIAPNIMVTVAHNYLDKDKSTGSGYVRGGNSAQSYVVMNSNSEKNGNNITSGNSELIERGNIHYYNQGEFAKSYTNDLAVVVLDKPVEAMTDGVDHARALGVASNGDTVTMLGYPNDFTSKNLASDVLSKLKNGKLYSVTGTISNLTAATGEGDYHMTALGGFSGGPLFNNKGEVVGIHQHGTNVDSVPEAQQHGSGLFFTEKHRAWLKEMVDKYAIKGWYVNGNDKFYYDDNHKPLVNTTRDIDGAKYSFDSNGRGTLLSGVEKGQLMLQYFDNQGEKLFERVVSKGNVGEAINYDFKKDSGNKEYFAKNPDAKVVSVDGEAINKKFTDNWSKDYSSKYKLGNTVIKVVVEGATNNKFNRTEPGQVDGSGGVNLPKMSDDVKNVPNGPRNFNATVVITTEAGLGSGTLINEDTIVSVAHNFVHLNTKTNPITVVNNVNKPGDVHIATLPDGRQVKFSNDDVKFWNRDGFVNGFKNDLVVIKLKNKFTGETPALVHDGVTKLAKGDKVHVFGYPKGKLNPILNGTVENVENYGANIMGIAYQGSAPGMSGGGMYNAQGELIGVHQNGVEGLRSGGITFSKEQLDWINAIARGENVKPVYLKDAPRDDGKGKEKPVDKVVTEVIEPTVEFVGDDSLEKDSPKVRIDGKAGSKVTTTTYVEDGKGGYKEKVLDPVITPATKTIIKVGTRPTVVTTHTEPVVVYEPDVTRDRGTPDEKVLGTRGTTIVTTTYKVDANTGDVTEEKGQPVITPATNTIIRVGVKDKVELIKGNGKTIEKRTVYTLDRVTGDVTEKVTMTELKVDVVYKADDTLEYGKRVVSDDGSVVTIGTKPTELVEEIEPEVVYEADLTREKGLANLVTNGIAGKKVTTIKHRVDEKTGEITEGRQEPVITPATKTIVKVAAQPHVVTKAIPKGKVYVADNKRDFGTENVVVDGKDGVSITTTSFEVDSVTGNITGRTAKPIVTEPRMTMVYVGAKPITREVKGDDGLTYEELTEYSVDKDTGVVTPKVTRELKGDTSTVPVDTPKADEPKQDVPTIEKPKVDEPINPIPIERRGDRFIPSPTGGMPVEKPGNYKVDEPIGYTNSEDLYPDNTLVVDNRPSYLEKKLTLDSPVFEGKYKALPKTGLNTTSTTAGAVILMGIVGFLARKKIKKDNSN